MVTPALDPVEVEILWSLVIPPDRSTAGLEQDLFLLWPGAVLSDAQVGPPEPALARYMKARGFSVIGEGRLALSSQSLYLMDSREPPTPIAGGASFVTVVREDGALGLTSPVTYVRIPWTPYQVNRARLMDLRFRAKGLIVSRHSSWVEEVFRGERFLLTLSFNDVRQRGVFPLYFEVRDRLVRLADDPSQLLVNFTDASHVKIDSVSPAASRRHLSESLDDTEVVSLFLDGSNGVTPQVLTVLFGYFSGWRAWAPVIIPALFFLLGNLAGPLLRFLGARGARALRARFHVGSPLNPHSSHDRGVVLSPEVLARIIPGKTTYDEVIDTCGADVEIAERLNNPEQRTLTYRGHHVAPQRRPILPWVARVACWDVQDQEIEITLDREVVSDVQVRVKRARAPEPVP